MYAIEQVCPLAATRACLKKRYLAMTQPLEPWIKRAVDDARRTRSKRLHLLGFGDLEALPDEVRELTGSEAEPPNWLA